MPPDTPSPLARAFHVSTDAVTLSSVADGRFSEVNEAFTEITGYERDEVIGRTSAELELWAFPEDRRQLVTELESSGRVAAREVRFRHKTGKLIDCQVSAEIVDIEDEPNLLFVVRDISQHKRAARQKQEIVAEIETATARIERFYDTLAHELRSPLVTIRGFLGLLQKDLLAGDRERVSRDVDRITAATEHMERSLDDLLELTRLGRSMGPKVEIDLLALTREILVTLTPRLAELDAQVRLAPDLPTVLGDRPRLTELLRHLLDNSLEHHQGHPPRLEIGTRPRSGADPGDDTIDPAHSSPVVFVRDQGPGIEPRFHERIFDLFERLDPTTEGTGLGLPLARRIVELHGGHLWVESEGEGQGATFCFWLAG